MRRKAIFPLLCCLLSLTLLYGCGRGQQAAGQLSGGPETSSPDQPVEEVHPEEEPAQTEVPAPETNGDSGEGTVPAVPQPPGIPAEQTEPAPGNAAADNTGNKEESTEMKMTVQVGDSTFTATLEDNAAVDALVGMMENGPVTIQMSDYAGFEKVGGLGISLPTNNYQTATRAGDIVLYQGNQIVLFYGSNSWSYTRLGKIDDLTGWTEALGSGDVSVTFGLMPDAPVVPAPSILGRMSG